jgi:predicted nucleic acid-binding protein
MIIVDTNIITALYIENPHQDEIDALLVRDPLWFAPSLWRSEFRNVLLQYIRHQIITLDRALVVMEASESLMGTTEFEPSSAHILRLADSSGCSAYDCEYVALARTLGTVLITFDRKLLSSFPAIAFTPAAFLASSG